MMKYGTSKDYPDIFVQRGKGTQFRFNVREVTKETEQGTETLHKYDYVEISGEVTYKKLVDAMIRAKYDVNDEFNVRSKAADDPDRVAFEEYVAQCKTNAELTPVRTQYLAGTTATFIDDYLVDDLDELYVLVGKPISGYSNMLKAEKLTALKDYLGIVEEPA